MQIKQKYILASIITLIICIGFAGASVYAESGKNSKDNLAEIEISGTVQSVDYDQHTLMVNSNDVHAVSRMIINGKSINTVLVDEKGGAVSFAELKKFQSVKVTGYQANEGYVIAKKIQILIRQLSDNFPIDGDSGNVVCQLDQDAIPKISVK
jgi:hypothetical protein